MPDTVQHETLIPKEAKMNTGKMEMTMEMQNTNPSTMSVFEILFGGVMVSACIYAGWVAVSLIMVVVK